MMNPENARPAVCADTHNSVGQRPCRHRGNYGVQSAKPPENLHTCKARQSACKGVGRAITRSSIRSYGERTRWGGVVVTGQNAGRSRRTGAWHNRTQRKSRLGVDTQAALPGCPGVTRRFTIPGSTTKWEPLPAREGLSYLPQPHQPSPLTARTQPPGQGGNWLSRLLVRVEH